MRNQKGFTLIELMIAVAIIGLLSAIAIPNFINYRNKSFCTRTESDANTIAASLSDYFSIPSRTQLPELSTNIADVGTGKLVVKLTGNNEQASLDRIDYGIRIVVPDGSGRCPQDYRDRMPADPDQYRDGWVGQAFHKFMFNY